MALNSYRLMCMESTVKDFPSEFLHQNTGEDLQQEIASRFPRKTGCPYFAAARVQQAFITKKTQRARLAWRNYT